jgi:hypothetical protein
LIIQVVQKEQNKNLSCPRISFDDAAQFKAGDVWKRLIQNDSGRNEIQIAPPQRRNVR